MLNAIPIITISSILLLAGCKGDTEKARSMLNHAYGLMREEKPDDAKKILEQLTEKYGSTQEATEAYHLLATLKESEKEMETWRLSILTSLASFSLDCGRYPTQAEGLDALLTDPRINGWRGPYWHSSSNVLNRFGYSSLENGGVPSVVLRSH